MVKKNIKFIFFIIVTTLLLITQNASARDDFTDHEISVIRQAEQYLNGITTLEADFTQISPYSNVPGNTSISYGKFQLSRPGKARWEYTAPNPQLIVINDGRLSYYDQELDQISYISMDDKGLSSFLTNANIDFFSGSIKVIDFAEDDAGFNIVLEDVKEEKEEGKITEQLRLTFLNDPLHLLRFNFKDINGRITTVELKNQNLDVAMDNDLFIFKNPRIGRNVWER